MKTYNVKKVSSRLSMNDPRWENADVAVVDEVWQDYSPSPYTTTARLVHTEDALILKMTTNEWPLAITAMKFNDSVCIDSCMEFFFIPNTVDKEYFNFEMNPAAIALTYIGEGRGSRTPYRVVDEGVEIEASVVGEKGWSVLAYIPYSFLLKHYSCVGKEMRGNFYKCGNNTVIPQYSTWNRVELPKPDYHRPEFFGKIILSDEEI